VTVNDVVCAEINSDPVWAFEGEEFFLVLASVEGDPIPLELDSCEWKSYVAERALSYLHRVK